MCLKYEPASEPLHISALGIRVLEYMIGIQSEQVYSVVVVRGVPLAFDPWHLLILVVLFLLFLLSEVPL